MSDKKWTEIVATPADNVWDRSEPIEGELTKVQHHVGPNSASLYTLLTADGEVALWGSTTLDSKLAELYLHDQVRIEPLGKVKSPKTGREYWDFKVSYIEGDRRAKAAAEEPDDVHPASDAELTSLDEIPF